MITSCAKEGPTGPAGPSTAYTGTISGHVFLYDQYGNKVLNNLDSVKIQLYNNPNNPMAFYADTVIHPDIYGYYTYTDVITTGQYYFTADDTGFGVTNINYFDFVSGTLNEDIKLSAIPTFSLTLTAAYQDTITGNDSLVINCTPDEQIRNCLIFVNAGYSLAAGEIYALSYTRNIPANATQISVVINGQELYDAGLVHDSRVYYTVFSHSLNDQSSYEDQSTGKTYYTAVSNPTIDSTYVP